jgi:transcriptional regulator with XRE-family HTH domain
MAEISGIFPPWGQAPEPLWREVLGRRLRALRADRDETLAQTADRAGISPQYLSEIERGRKEPSSEMIAALAGALDTTLADLTLAVTEDLRRLSLVRAGTRAVISGAAGARVADLGRPAASRAPAPPVALAMAA